MSKDFEKNYKTWHGYWSFIKSALRFAGCISVLYFDFDIKYLAGWLMAAEVLGVVEEWI